MKIHQIICFSLFLALMNSISFAQETIKVKDYYVPIYKDQNIKSKVIGNLKKGHLVMKVKMVDQWIQINAFNGLIVGWTEAKSFETGSQTTIDYMPIDSSKMSPTFPGKELLNASKKAKNPHQGPYKGVQYCVSCHHPQADPSIPGKGKPIETWSSTKHSNAYHTLFSKKSLDIAKKLGIKQPYRSDQCLKCHVTGFGVPEADNQVAHTEGVGCEACHGPGNSLYGSKGEWDITQIETRSKFCEKCHNAQSPTFEGFNLETFSENIAHWKHDEEVNQIRIEEHKQAVEQSKKDDQGEKIIADSIPKPVLLDPNEKKESPSNPEKKQQEGWLTLHHGSKEAVHFPHEKHKKEFGLKCQSCHHEPSAYKCSSCHHDESQVSRRDAFHNNCINCHREMANQGYSGPVNCSQCHQK